ncbi:MAG: helicase-related protein, partial [Chitinophagales bacterium]
DWKQVLVFTRTKHGANRLCQKMEKKGITAAAIHGNKSQAARTRALANFKKGQVRVLVATDIAARGLDIPLLPHVINFELPNIAEAYVHRIGRTGRAGASGEAISLVSHDERDYVRGIERLLGEKLEQEVIEGFEPSENPPPPKSQNSSGRSSRKPRPKNGSGNGNRRNFNRRPKRYSKSTRKAED